MILKNYLKKSIIVFFLFTPSFTLAIEQPFQQCNEKNKEFTDHVVKKFKEFDFLEDSENQTEAGHCVDCDNNESFFSNVISSIVEVSKNKILPATYAKLIPPECFLANALRGSSVISRNQSGYCSDENFEDTYYTGRRKHCINEDYIDMISEAFYNMSYCFDLSKEDQVGFFHLINHESAFILNASSNTRARCLGQVTRDYVRDINNRIIQGKGKDLYNEILSRCPNLKNKLLLKTTEGGEVSEDFRYLSCKTTHDPYTCLFYTFFDLKVNHNTISEFLNSPLSYRGSREFPENFPEEKIGLPLKLNEILLMDGSIEGKQRNLLVWDDSELLNIIQHLDRQEKLIKVHKTTKLPLFKDSNKVARMLNLWSHNGGNSIARHRGRIMIEELKRDIARKPPNCTPKACDFREKIQRGESLSTEEVHSYLKTYIKNNYPSNRSSRRNEVSNYVQNILSDSNIIFKGTGAGTSDDWNYYNKEFLNSEDLGEEDKSAFVDRFREICPSFSLE